MCTKKNVATPFDATTSFLRLELSGNTSLASLQKTYFALINSQGETDHVPLSLICRPTISMQSAANWHCLIV